jgi:beta-glucuronidase
MGWLNYGGLIRPVYFTIEPEVYAENIKIDAVPDLAKGTAIIKTKLRIRNASKSGIAPKIGYNVLFNGKTIPLTWKTKPQNIAAGQTFNVEAEATLLLRR